MRKTMFYRKKIWRIVVASTLLFASHSASANWLADNDVALGLEGGALFSGFSAKVPYTSQSSWQITLSDGAYSNALGVRFISEYMQKNDWRIYWHGGIGTSGVAAGVLADFDLSKLNIPLPVLISFSIGPSYRWNSPNRYDIYGYRYDRYDPFTLFDLSLGFHYHFK